MKKGWFKIPGVQDGDRTAEEQLFGVREALDLARGKSVLDLGCAEGVIALEFLKAGCSRLVGIELLEQFVATARALCAGYQDRATFVCQNLIAYIEENPEPERFDVVLALSIVHKLRDPTLAVRLACRSANELIVYRAPWFERDGYVRSKFTEVRCHVPTVMAEYGFEKSAEFKGSPRKERVEFWSRR